MSQQLIPIVLMCLLLLAILSPFSALAALMLLAVGSLLYGLGASILRALLTPDQSPD